MSNQWLHMYHQTNLPNSQPPSHLSNNHDDLLNTNDHSGIVSDSTVVTTAVSSTTTPPTSDGSRVAKPVRKRSRASRRTPTTLLNTDAANFRAMVQQFTGGPSNANNNLHNFATLDYNSNSQTLFDPTAAAYHLQDPPQQPTVFQFQNQPLPLQQPPFMFSLSNSAADEAFFHQTHGGGSRNNNINYMGVFDGSSPAAQNPRRT